MNFKSITRILFFAVAILTLFVNSTVAQNTSLNASPTVVLGGQSVVVSWSNLEATGNDWISLHPADQSDSVYLNWQNAYGSSGSVTFSAPSQAGWYDFRLFRNGGKVATSNAFEVQVESIPIPEAPTENPVTPVDNGHGSYYPAVSAPSITPTGDCRWDLWFQLSGFAPNSEITVTSNYSAANCVGEQSNSTWSGVMGTTDGGGSFSYGVVHQDTGTYNYTFSDSQGNSAVITFSTNQSTTNPEIPLPSTPDISSGSTLIPGSSATPIHSPPLLDCSQSPGIDLVIGESGYVNSISGGNVNLRNAPTTTGAVVQSMVNGAEFIVMDGPICADGYWWWELTVAGQTGWAVGQLLAMVIVPEIVQTPTSSALPLYIQAQSGDGIHFGIYCRDKYQADEYREEGNARSWSCKKDGTRITLNLDDVCHDVWGDERPYISIPNESDIRGLTCQAQPQSGVPQSNTTQHSTNPKQCYAEQEDRTPGDTTVLRGTIFTFRWRVRCDDGENNGLPRAVKIEIDGVSYAEIAANEQTYTWDTSNVSFGNHDVCFMGASHGDEYWEIAARSCWVYQIVDQLPTQLVPTATSFPPPSNGDTSTEVPVYGCPALLPPRLSIGGQGRSTSQGQSLNIRASAGLNWTITGTLSNGQIFSVLEGPVCADGMNWWEINISDFSGWVAEGSNGVYFVDRVDTNPDTDSEQCIASARIRYLNNSETIIQHQWQLRVTVNYSQLGKGFQVYYRGRDVTHDVGNLDLAGSPGENYVDFWVSSYWAWSNSMTLIENRSPYYWSVVFPC